MIRKLFSLAALTFLLASCTNAIDNVDNLQQQTKQPVFYATIEGSDAATKVYADEQLRVLWNADDRISLFNKTSGNQQYQFQGEDGDNAGEFTAVPDNGNVNGNALAHIYALYPHNSTTEISNDGIITATLPAKQTYKTNSFGIGANTMVSVTDDTQLRFKNVGGYLSFKFFGDCVPVISITLKGNNGEKLAGKASITMSVGGTPTVVMQQEATESITLTCETPVMISSSPDYPTEFCFVLPPTTFNQGFTVTVTDALGGTFTITTTNEVAISRNNLSRMSLTEVVPDYTGIDYQAVERNALINFYQAMNGDNWLHKDNWCSDKPLDEWYGIQANKYVEGIDLSNNNLAGALSSDLFVPFTRLSRLELSNNYIPNVQWEGNNSVTHLILGDIPAKEAWICDCPSLKEVLISGELESVDIKRCDNITGNYVQSSLRMLLYRHHSLRRMPNLQMVLYLPYILLFQP